jgi:hypothetical protein
MCNIFNHKQLSINIHVISYNNSYLDTFQIHNLFLPYCNTFYHRHLFHSKNICPLLFLNSCLWLNMLHIFCREIFFILILFYLFFIIYNSIQHYVIKFVCDLRQVGGFLRVLRFPPPIKLTATM